MADATAMLVVLLCYLLLVLLVELVLQGEKGSAGAVLGRNREVVHCVTLHDVPA